MRWRSGPPKPKQCQSAPANFFDSALLSLKEPDCQDGGPSDKGIACMSTPLDASSVRVGNVDASG